MSVAGVFKAIGKIAKTTSQFGIGVGKTTGQFGIGAGNSAYNLFNTVMRSTGTMKESLAKGQVIPFKLKHGLGAAGFLAVGMSNMTEEVSQGPAAALRRAQQGEFEEGEIPNTLNRNRSPKIDDMGATGDIVLAAHKGR